MQLDDLYNRFRESENVNTDTRTIQQGDMFIALSGENFDGNQYVDIALEKGAHHVVCSDKKYAADEKVTVVEDALKTLQLLASFHRKQLKTPIIALTGSNGKTTTKELIVSVLSQQFHVTATKGNLNNHIGVPLTLLSFTNETEIGVVEMGANHLKEIESLCEIAYPDIGLITNFGKAHLEGFGSLEGVRQGKSELYKFLAAHKGRAIVRPQDKEQLNRTENMNRRLAPSFEMVESEPLILKWDRHKFQTNLTGIYNVGNMELAAAAGLEMGMPADKIITGIKEYTPDNNRSQLLSHKGSSIIMDAYNANPTSMEAALRNLAVKLGFKTAILGDMFELGSYSNDEHQRIVDLVKTLQIDRIILVGNHFYETNGSDINKFQDFESLSKSSNDLDLNKEQTILIKGSRGMAMERVLDLI